MIYSVTGKLVCVEPGFAVVEAATVGLVSLWFAIGALVALLSTFFTANIWLQIGLFSLVSAVALVLLRPLSKKYVAPKAVPTNADRVVDQTASVTETIDNEAGRGQVSVLGQVWTARSELGVVIPAGTQVKVQKIEGVKLLVQYSEKVEVRT